MSQLAICIYAHKERFDATDLSFPPHDGYRADHQMTLRAKELIRSFYNTDPKYSYWIGCSLGGMEALVEAERYPKDYDGIVAGAPMNPMTMFNPAQMWPAWLSQHYPKALSQRKSLP